MSVSYIFYALLLDRSQFLCATANNHRDKDTEPSLYNSDHRHPDPSQHLVVAIVPMPSTINPHHCPGAKVLGGNCHRTGSFCKTHQVVCNKHANVFHLYNKPCPSCIGDRKADEKKANEPARKEQKKREARAAEAAAAAARSKGKNPTKEILKAKK